MLGRDRGFLGAECLCYASYGFPGKDALEDAAQNGGGFNYPLAFFFFGSAVVIAFIIRAVVYFKAKNARKYRHRVEYGSVRRFACAIVVYFFYEQSSKLNSRIRGIGNE